MFSLFKKKKKEPSPVPVSDGSATTEKLPPKSSEPIKKAEGIKDSAMGKRPIEVFNLQGIGSREEQQDAFGFSPLSELETQGLLAILCDGMGGMAEGGRISREVTAELLSIYPWEEDGKMLSAIDDSTRHIYRQFMGQGGTTLVAAKIMGNELSFWCVGDSDLFLLREGVLYALNERQEYRNTLIRNSLDSLVSLASAFYDPQGSSLSEYIGKERVNADYTKRPLTLRSKDVLLLCSDGVSDTLSFAELKEMLCMEKSLDVICEEMERRILDKNKPGQDNYTAIVIRI